MSNLLLPYDYDYKNKHKSNWDLILTGLSRISFIVLLLSAWIFSWTVSLVPDSDWEKKILRCLGWQEGLVCNKADHANHWLLKNVNSSYEKERFVFIPTAWLHEKWIIKNPDRKELDKYDPARITEATEDQCPKRTKCYRIDSWLPRNLILRERVLTTVTDLKPELAASLQAEGDSQTDALNRVSGLNLQGRNFDYMDISNSSLPKVDLRRSYLRQANLSKARLNQAQLQSSYLERANLGKLSC